MIAPLMIISKCLLRGWLLVAVVFLVACSSGMRDRKVLPVDEMAKVLYDYQLATSLAQEDNQGTSPENGLVVAASDSVLAESHRNYLKYKSAVLAKYQISESDYKHSLAFYLRNPEEMKQLNAHLERRIAEVNGQYAAANRQVATASDSVVLWNKDRVLLDAATSNRYVYEGPTKGRRLRNEALILSFDAQWLYGGGNKQAQAFLSAIYDNDSVSTTYYSIYYFQNHHEVRLPLAQRNLKKVSVQFASSSTWEAYPQVVNFSQIKLHRVKEASVATSSSE